jgi:predicted DNA-binding transcriptional regulator AlpA
MKWQAIDPLISEIEAARLLGLSRRFLQCARAAGRPPRYCKLGRRVLYRRSDLVAFIEAGIRGSSPAGGEGAGQ